MKNLFTLLFCTAALLSAAGCTDSEDNESDGPNMRGDASLLLGKWNTTWCSDVFYENGKKVDSERSKDDWFTFELFDDGTFEWTETPDTPDTGTYTYNTTDFSLALFFKEGLGGSDFGLGAADKTEVKFLSDKKFVIYMENTWIEEENPGITYFATRELSFRKIE